MTGTCKLCRELVTGAPVLEVGLTPAARDAAEVLTFAEAMRRHVGSRHLDAVQVYGGVLTIAAAYFSALFADSTMDGFETGLEVMRDSLLAQIRDAKVVIAPSVPVDRPLVVPS